MAVQKLRSRDLLLDTVTMEARETLEKHTNWTTKVYKTTTIVRKTFPVIVHGIKISAFNANRQEEIKQKIERENTHLHPGMEVVKARWLPGTDKLSRNGQPKKDGSLVISVATPEMADGVIQRGLIEAGMMKLAEKFEPKGSLLQCHNCQEYGHMYKSCSNPTRCATCSGNHSTRDHEEQALKAEKACAACNKSGHPSWSPTCPVRMKERHKAAQRKANMAPLYGIQRETPKTPEKDAEAYTIVSSKKRKASGEPARAETPISILDSQQSSSQSSQKSKPETTTTRKPGRPPKLPIEETGQKTLLSVNFNDKEQATNIHTDQPMQNSQEESG